MTLTHINPSEVLREEIVPFEQLLTIVSVAVHPFRFNYKGLDCIVGKFIQSRTRINEEFLLLPAKLSRDDKDYLREFLELFEKLKSPVSAEVAHAVTDAFILQGNVPWVPNYISETHLEKDVQRRKKYYKKELEYVKEEVTAGRLCVVDMDRRRCEFIGSDVFFSLSEAKKYLDSKGLEKVYREPSNREIYSLNLLDASKDKALPLHEPKIMFPLILKQISIADYRVQLISQRNHKAINYSDNIIKDGKSFDEMPRGEAKCSVPERNLMDDRKDNGVESYYRKAEPESGVDQNKAGDRSSSQDTVFDEFLGASISPTSSFSFADSPGVESEKDDAHETKVYNTEYIGIVEVAKIVGVSKESIENFVNGKNMSCSEPFPICSRDGTARNIRKWVRSEIVAWAKKRHEEGRERERNTRKR